MMASEDVEMTSTEVTLVRKGNVTLGDSMLATDPSRVEVEPWKRIILPAWLADISSSWKWHSA